jgi:hypothetical protein
MLIWPRAASMLFVVTLVVVCGALWGLVDRLLRHVKSELPVAVVASGRVRTRSRLLGFVMVIGLAGLWWQCSHSTNIVLVTDGDDGPIVTRGVWLGGIDGYAKAAGHAGPSNDGAEWIDNRSSTEVFVDDIDYGFARSLLLAGLETRPRPPRRVAPDTMYAVPSVDFVGPSSPPSEIFISETAHGKRYVWLHWSLADGGFSERVPLLQPPSH